MEILNNVMLWLLSGIFVMLWVLSGLFSVFLMQRDDDGQSDQFKGDYWLKNQPNKKWEIAGFVLAGPYSLLIGILALMSYKGR